MLADKALWRKENDAETYVITCSLKKRKIEDAKKKEKARDDAGEGATHNVCFTFPKKQTKSRSKSFGQMRALRTISPLTTHLGMSTYNTGLN